MEIMLYDPDVSEAEIIRLLREGERLSKILAPRFLFGCNIREKLNAKFHAAS
jgi:hypothetical protein